MQECETQNQPEGILGVSNCIAKFIKDYALPLAVVAFAALQWWHTERVRDEDLRRIQFQAIYHPAASDVLTGRLVVRQISGEPFIMENLELLVSGDNIKSTNANIFTIDVIEYAAKTEGLTYINIDNIGELICGRIVDENCNPKDDFRIKFRYRVFDQQRNFRDARRV